MVFLSTTLTVTHSAKQYCATFAEQLTMVILRLSSGSLVRIAALRSKNQPERTKVDHFSSKNQLCPVQAHGFPTHDQRINRAHIQRQRSYCTTTICPLDAWHRPTPSAKNINTSTRRRRTIYLLNSQMAHKQPLWPSNITTILFTNLQTTTVYKTSHTVDDLRCRKVGQSRPIFPSPPPSLPISLPLFPCPPFLSHLSPLTLEVEPLKVTFSIQYILQLHTCPAVARSPLRQLGFLVDLIT